MHLQRFLHKGIVYKALRHYTLRDLKAIGFQESHYITGVQSSVLGISDCSFYDLHAFETRYAFWITNGNAALETGGYANELAFFGGRTVINTNTGSNKHVSDPANFQAFRVDYPNNASLSGSIPNNIRIFGMNLEGAWGRKFYCRGEDVYLYACRYEVPNGGTDLEVDKVSNGGTGRRIFFIGGQGLDSAVLVKTNTVGGATPPQYVAKLSVSNHRAKGRATAVAG